MLLRDYLDRYNRLRDLRPSTLDHYRWVVRSLEVFHGQPVRLKDLRAELVSDWLTWLKDQGRSPFTLKQRRISLLVLWRSAWESGLAPAIGPVKRLRPVRNFPEAWSLEEVRKLIAAAEGDPTRPLFWASLVRAGYDSGLRVGDLLGLKIGQVASVLVLQQAKTRQPVVVRFRQASLEAIRRQSEGREVSDAVWPLWGRREAFYRAFRRLVSRAGIRPGTFRWLRRTAATQLEVVSPGRGTELLGHIARATTETWYLDRSQLSHPPLPPL